MAFYKKQHNKKFGVWYPSAITVGQPVPTKKVAQRLSAMCTVTYADVMAVLGELPGVMAEVGAPRRAGNLPLHAVGQGREQRNRLRLPEAASRRARSVRAPARGPHDEGRNGHTRTGAHGHRVAGLRPVAGGFGRQRLRTGRL